MDSRGAGYDSGLVMILVLTCLLADSIEFCQSLVELELIDSGTKQRVRRNQRFPVGDDAQRHLVRSLVTGYLVASSTARIRGGGCMTARVGGVYAAETDHRVGVFPYRIVHADWLAD